MKGDSLSKQCQKPKVPGKIFNIQKVGYVSTVNTESHLILKFIIRDEYFNLHKEWDYKEMAGNIKLEGDQSSTNKVLQFRGIFRQILNAIENPEQQNVLNQQYGEDFLKIL